MNADLDEKARESPWTMEEVKDERGESTWTQPSLLLAICMPVTPCPSGKTTAPGFPGKVSGVL